MSAPDKSHRKTALDVATSRGESGVVVSFACLPTSQYASLFPAPRRIISAVLQISSLATTRRGPDPDSHLRRPLLPFSAKTPTRTRTEYASGSLSWEHQPPPHQLGSRLYDLTILAKRAFLQKARSTSASVPES